MKKLFTIVLFCCFWGSYVVAQSLTIKNVSLQPNDKTAFLSPCLDSNGDTCALIKIKIPDVKGIEFPNKSQYIKSTYDDGVYLIYMPTISRRLDYRHASYLPGQIDLGEYGYRRLKAGKTYMVQMEAPLNKNEGSLLILKVSPVGARLSFNGARQGLSSTGVYEFPLREGTYSYAASMDDYAPFDGSIQIGKDENKTIAIDLKPIMHSVKVNCNVGDAHVFVDNVDYGEVGMLSLPQGEHHIRIQGDGYLDAEENVNIQSNMGPLSYSLKKNKNIKEIHATPVRIYTNSPKVYKNNKEIRDWEKSGDVVLIMPGKYEISDYGGNIKRIEVGTDSMSVYLSETETPTRDPNNIDKKVEGANNTNYNMYQQNYRTRQQQDSYYYRRNSTRNSYYSNPTRRTNNQTRSGYTNGVYQRPSR